MGDRYRLLVTGSRSLLTWRPVYQSLGGWQMFLGTTQLVVVHGDARQGVDAYARQFVEWCRSHGYNVDQEPYPADWDGPCDFESGMCQPGHRRSSRFGSSPDYCPTAGHRRNEAMVRTMPISYVAITDRPLKESKGTHDCVKRADAASIPGERLELHLPAGVTEMRFDTPN
jgi:hypothetical protein